MAKTGIWSKPGDKILPGVYSKIESIVNSYGDGLIGTIGVPVKANWGPIGEVVTLENNINKLIDMFGNDTEEKYSAFKIGALLTKTNLKYIKFYRLADESAKQSTINLQNTNESAVEVIKLTSKYATSKDLNVTIKNSLVNTSSNEMYVYEGSKLLAKITGIKGTCDEMVDVINNAHDNKYLIASKIAETSDPLAPISNKKLAGGNDGCTSVNNEMYIKSLDQFERTQIDGFVLDGKEDESLDASVFDWIKKNYESGRIISYFSGIGKSEDISSAFTKAKKINNKLYTLVASAGVLDDIQYTPSETAAYLCGVEISNKLRESSCNKKVIFTDVKKVFTTEELEEAQKVGVLTLDIDDGDVVIVDDVNTYKTYSENNKKDSVFGFNRSIRTLKAINTMLVSAGKQIIGKVDNDPEFGYDIVISLFKRGFEALIADGAIKEFEVEIDKELQAVAENDEIYIRWYVTRSDKVKKIYSKGTIR
ncbi:phage tail sheath subtilisin-like domain-containing protein [Peptostreptococcus sp. D1]|uniref:phage tail sheath subtilisin-like domain-containing protein n=1 Tax=Peptostreptococcus sp. D1 TaxID=72304 RepID=UPI0008EA695F|nr:phage tail sheath subtilisin-like domain-containing protein [Peptostreptococcus sp. D1]SFE92072.1 Phage tail sheath protein [Peptostreptococcus sp. D1]